MASNGQGTIYIDMSDFLKFVEEGGSIPAGAERIYGDPRFADDGFAIEYAYDECDCHPSEWSDAPAFINRRSRINALLTHLESGQDAEEVKALRLELRAAGVIE